jgi:hypothetical protein
MRWVLTRCVCGVSPDIVIGEVCIYVFVKNNTEHVINKLFVKNIYALAPSILVWYDPGLGLITNKHSFVVTGHGLWTKHTLQAAVSKLAQFYHTGGDV